MDCRLLRQIPAFSSAPAAAAAAPRVMKQQQQPAAVSRRSLLKRDTRITCSRASFILPLPAAIHLDGDVLLTSLGASINIVSVIALVAWMQKSGYLPSETPVVLSQVAFRITIPCYLMSKVSSILATQAKADILLVPFVAVVQVLLGAALGKLFCRLVYRLPSRDKLRTKKEALVTTACAFGNTLALPLVFLSGVLSPTDLSISAGYLAMFMVGWSPALWTVAYNVLSNTGGSQEADDDAKVLKLWDLISVWQKRILNPPLYGVLVGLLVGCTPISNIVISQKAAAVSNNKILLIMSRLLAPVYDAAVFLGTAAPPVQLTVLACSLAGVMRSRKANLPHSWGPKKLKSTVQDSSLSANVVPPDASTTKLLKTQEFLIVFCVRSLVLPVTFNLMLSVLESLKILNLDPLCKLTLQILSAMPSAQNLVLLSQLRPSTRPFAKEFASLLLKQYVASLLPMTVWTAVFLANLRSSS